MKKLIPGLLTLITLVACQEMQQVNPIIPNPANHSFVAASSNRGYHPDFARKLSNPLLYRFQPETIQSICGTDDLQQVNDYDGSLGQPVEFVKQHKPPVAALAMGSLRESRKFCSGTLISEDLFLTAGHCVDSTITKDKYAVFNYEKAAKAPNLLEQEQFKIKEVVEDGLNNLDYAIIKLDGKPGLKYGFTPVRATLPEKGHLLTIIQHPHGEPKQIESGPMAGVSGNYMNYADLDTQPGSSGSGVLDKDGFLVGVHTNGGCGSSGGTNSGVLLTEILKASKVIQDLNQTRAIRR